MDRERYGSTVTSGSSRQATRAGLAFAGLHNGFASCSEPERLQALPDSFGPEHIQAFFDH